MGLYIIMATATVFPQTELFGENLADATISILQRAFWLESQRQRLSNKQYKQVLTNLGWDTRESKTYLKIARTFKYFAPEDLKEVEPNTILELAKHSKKYRTVIEKLQYFVKITQQTVRELIASICKPKTPLSDKATIWKMGKDGQPVCHIPDIMEDDRLTGSIIQKAMDEKGMLPQTVIREAVALWQAFNDGKLWSNQDGYSEPVEDIATEAFSSFESESKTDLNEESQFCDSTVASDSPVPDEEIAPSVTEENKQSQHEPAILIHPTPVEVCDNKKSVLEQILSALQQAKSWSEVVSITENCSQQEKVDTWELLDTNSKNRLHQLKKEYIENLTTTPRVNDKVIWENCPTYLYDLQPLVIISIEADNAMLDNYPHPVPLEELKKYLDKT
jgi:hypothetical protein